LQKLNTSFGQFIYRKNFAVNIKLKRENREESYAGTFLTLIMDIGC
jgi:hypothetical protein